MNDQGGTMFIKPAKEGLIVRHPKTKRILKKEGEKVKSSTYWRRRIKDGSVVEVSASASKPKKETKKPEIKKDGGN